MAGKGFSSRFDSVATVGGHFWRRFRSYTTLARYYIHPQLATGSS